MEGLKKGCQQWRMKANEKLPIGSSAESSPRLTRLVTSLTDNQFIAETRCQCVTQYFLGDSKATELRYPHS